MSNLLSVPVSAVDSDWIASELYPQLDQALEKLTGGGVLWLGTDSRREGNYLLQRIRVFAQERGMNCGGLAISEHDPYLFWDDVVGTGDEPAALWTLKAQTLACVENGYLSPRRLVRERHHLIAAYARASGVVLVVPVAHVLRKDLEPAPFIAAPPFVDVPEQRRRELAEALLGDAFPGWEPAQRGTQARDLIDANPVSRVELEEWVDYLAEKTVDSKDWRVPPPIPRHDRNPAEAPTRGELHARLMASMATLNEASATFAAWRGRPLIRPIRQPPDPFEARDPFHWFAGTISYLACYLFDAVDDGLPPLLGWRWNETSGEIEAADPLSFMEDLRALRTAMQHGLDEDHPRNQETLKSVERWCRVVSGAGNVRREHCRALTARLLSDWDATARRLAAVAVHALQSKNRDLIDGQLDLAVRRLPKFRWRELLEAASVRLGVDVEVTGTLDRHLTKLQKALVDAPEKASALADRANQLAVDALLEELARCPVTGEDLLGAGVPKGPLLGKAKNFVNEQWASNHSLDRDTLVAMARERFVAPAIKPDTPSPALAATASVQSDARQPARRPWLAWGLLALGALISIAIAIRLITRPH